MIKKGFKLVESVQEEVKQRPSAYPEALDAIAKQCKFASEMGLPTHTTTDPAIVDAFVSGSPSVRYSVGGLVHITRFLASLPDAWADTIMRLTS